MAENQLDLNTGDLSNSMNSQEALSEQQSFSPFNNTDVVGGGLVNTGLPDTKVKIRTNPTPNVSSQVVPGTRSIDDVMAAMNNVAAKDPFYGTGARDPGLTPISEVNKYADQKYGYVPGIDNEDFYGKQQSWYNKTANGLFTGVGKVLTKVGTGVGYMGGLMSPWNWGTEEGVFSKAADNALSTVSKELEEYISTEWFPTFQEAEDRDKGFWSRAATDLDFWTTDVVDGAAFMASAWIPGMALSKLGIGAMAMRGLGSVVGTSAKGLGATIEGAERISNYFAKAQTAAKNLDAFGAWSLATSSEAMFEANGVRDEVIKGLGIDKYGNPIINPETGDPFTEEEKRKRAGEAAQNTFLMNSMVLGVSNVFEWKYLSKMLGKAENKVAKGIIAGELGEQATLTPLSPSWQTFGKTAAKGIAREGFYEENMQLAIQRYNTEYGMAGKVGSMLDIGTYGNVLNQYIKQTGAALKGEDQEAAMSIGLGGILGAGMSGAIDVVSAKKEYANAERILSAFNESQNQWLKAGNIFKTEEFETKDDNGNPFTTKRIVLDENQKPIVDEDKLNAVVSGMNLNSNMIEESEKEVNKTKRNFLKAEAFGDFVSAHINAGVEDTLLEKLDRIKTSKPEDVARFGFVADQNLIPEIDKYKALAANIIKQNKILNEDILFDNSKEDYNRKNYLTQLAAKQSVRKFSANELSSELQDIKNELVNSENSSLSDGLVEQLNDLRYRIVSQENIIESIKEKGLEKLYPMDVYESALNELKSSYKKVVADNKSTVDGLKKNKEEGFYDYEKAERNEIGVRDRIESKVFRKGELLNEVRNSGLTWAKYADIKTGKKSFVNDFKSVVEKQTELKEEFEKKKEEAAAAKTTAASKPTGVDPLKELAKKGKIETTDEEGNVISLNVKKGKVFKRPSDTGVPEYVTILNISADGKVITVKSSEEGAIDLDADTLIKLAKSENWEEVKDIVKKIKVEHPKELESTIAIESNPDSPTFKHKRPKFEEVGFNKTFGRHYIDDNDTEPNTENGSDRFFTFTAKYDAANENYGLEVITESNDKFGIRQEGFPNDIKVVVVRKTKDKAGNITYNYVDVDNNIIPEGEATKDNIVYRSLGNVNNLSPEYIRRELYTVDETTNDDQILKQINDHIEYQKNLAERTKQGDVYLDIVGMSPGIERIEFIYTDAIEKSGDRQLKMAPAEGRLIAENPDWSALRSINNPSNYIGLRVNTADNALAPGILSGRVVLQEYSYDPITGNRVWSDNKVNRVFNRPLTDSEKNTVIQAIARFSELFGKPSLSVEESAEYSLILGYLKGVTNWSAPKDNQNPERYMWVQNGLHIGDNVIEFNKGNVLVNADAITSGMYHHVNNRMLWNNEPFQLIEFIDDKAVPSKEYKTYEEYLLHKRDNGEVPPVYTSKPLYDSETPQRTNVYMLWSDPGYAELKPLGKVKRDYNQPKEEKTPKKYGPTDIAIRDFINYRILSITVNGVSITYFEHEGNIYIEFKNTTTGQSKISQPYATVNDILNEKYKIRSQILEATGHVIGEGVTFTDLQNKKGSPSATTKSSVKTKGTIKLNLAEDLVQQGIATATVRSRSYHDKFYKGDGVYKTEAGNLVNVTYRGLVKLTKGRIRGKDIDLSKNEFAQAEGYKSWPEFDKEPKWASRTLIKGEAVHYYSISPAEDVTTNAAPKTLQDLAKQAKTQAKTQAAPAAAKTGLDPLRALAAKAQQDAKGKTKTPTKAAVKSSQRTVDLFLEGNSPQEILEIRQKDDKPITSIVTIEKHLIDEMDNLPKDSLRRLVSPEKENFIVQKLKSEGGVFPALKDAYIALENSDITYFELRAALALNDDIKISAEAAPVVQSTASTIVKQAEEKLRQIWNSIGNSAGRNAIEDGWAESFGYLGETASVGGQNYQAHGMGKSGFAYAIRDLFELFNKGIDTGRGGGQLYTAPLAISEENKAAASAIGTAGGTAYADGSFILVAKKGIVGIRNIDDIGGILVNSGLTDINPEILTELRKAFPNLVIESYKNAKGLVEQLNQKTPTQPTAPVSDNTKTPIEGLNKRLEGYGSAKVVLPANFYEGDRPKGRLNAFKSAITKVSDNLIVLGDLNLKEFDFLSEQDKKRLDALRPLAEELRILNMNDISLDGRRTVAVEKRYAQLTNQLANEFVDIVSKHVEQQLGKTINSSNPKLAALEGATIENKAATVEEALENAKVVGNKLKTKIYKPDGSLIAEVEVPIPSGNIQAATNILRNALVSKMSENFTFRMPIGEVEQSEDFQNLGRFMKEKLPQFSVKRMANMIHGKAWGMFHNGMIYIYENAEVGTGFHEAFEGVWAAYLTEEERAAMIEEFRNRSGKFKNVFTNEVKDYKDASEYDVREMLAEEFRKFILDGGYDTTLGQKIINFFKDLWNAIREFFGLSVAERSEFYDNINDVFNGIKDGKFKGLSPIRELTEMAPQYSAVGTLTEDEKTSVMEGLTYQFFANVYSKGNNIVTTIKGLSAEESSRFLADNFNDAFEKMLGGLRLIGPRITDKVDSHRADLYDYFKKSLEKYGLVFTDLEVDEEAVNDPLGIRNSMTIDPRKMTNNSVLLLLASLPQVVYRNGQAAPVINMYNQPKLIDADRAHTTLINELSNISAIINSQGERVNVINQMFNKLDDKYQKADGTYIKDYGWIKKLKERLKYEDADGNLIDATTLKSEEMSLRVAFIKSFNNIKTIPDKTIVNDEGYIYNFNPVANVNTDRVRQNWNNNLKIQIQNKKNKIVKVENGSIVFDRSSTEFGKLMGNLNKPIELGDAIDIFKKIGIEFSGSLEALDDSSTMLKENARFILGLIRDGEINKISDIYYSDKVEKRVKQLLELESKFTSDDNILTYLNADGEPQYSVGIPSLFSQTINILNTVKSQEELIRTCPWLGYIDESGEVVLNAYQKGSDLLKKGGILFEGNGDRRTGNTNQITYRVISGMGLTDTEGTTTSDLQFPERVANKIHYLLQNVVFSNINSDKSTEFGIGIPGKLSVNEKNVVNFMLYNAMMANPNADKRGLALVKDSIDKSITSKYVSHLLDEMASATQQKTDPVFIQYYQTGVNSLGHFRDVLSKSTLTKFKDEVLSSTPKFMGPDAHIDFMNENLEKIQDEINKYLYNKILETSDFLKDLDLFQKVDIKGEEMYISDAIDNDTLETLLNVKQRGKVSIGEEDAIERILFDESDINVLAGILAINEELLATEQHKLIYGHPAMYKDFAKRANGATSTKEASVEDSDVIRWMDKNMPRLDNKVRAEDVHQKTKVITFKDQNVVSLFWKDIAEGIYQEMLDSGVAKEDAEIRTGARFNDDKTIKEYIFKNGEPTGAIKAYLELNESDAMAWGLPDAIRDMLFSTAKITAEQEAQWNYEIAYEKVARSSKPKTDPSYKEYKSEELEIAKEIVKKKNPGYVFNVLKPQYFGYADTQKIMHPVFLKHAVQPKFFRHVEGTQYESLYVAAQNNQIDIIGFESGEKVGAVTDNKGELTPIYNTEGKANVEVVKKGDLNTYDLPKSLAQTLIYTRFYGIQVEMSSKPKSSVVRGTQVTKLIMVNFFSNGAPINKEVGDLITEYNDTLRKMIRLGKVQLLRELGLEKVGDNYEAKNLRSLIEILRKEARNRDLPDNIINAINALDNSNGTQSVKYYFDTLINREKIDNIINSIVDSRVISAKMFGKASVQVASALYETDPRTFSYIKDGVYKTLTKSELADLTEEQKSSIKMTSNDLKFYYKKDGSVQAMEAYVSWPFKEVTPEELGLKLENGIYKIPEGGLPNLSKELLTIIGFRIPTQAPNSIEKILIKGFTPAANGDMIVVPSEIVGKSGSDFDIDKLNLYFNRYEVPIKDYGSKEFKNFVINGLIKKGISSIAAEALIDGPRAYTKKQLEQINRATYTPEGKELLDADFYLGEVVDEEEINMAATIKKILTDYNAQFKGPKKILYIGEGEDSVSELQNKLIRLMGDLISRPENYGQLVTPNSVATMKNLATAISKKKIDAGTKEVSDEKSYTYLRTFIGSSKVRERYLTAKRMVGIAALHSTFHAMAQVAGIKANSTFKTKGIHYLMPKTAKGIYQEVKDINIKIRHKPAVSVTDQDGNEIASYYNLGHRLDVMNRMISDLFSEAVSGFVDGAKDPFVFDLNLSLSSAGTWFYLLHHGAPMEDVAYLFAQPIMDKYFDATSKNSSNFKKANKRKLSKQDLFIEVVAPYYDKVFKTDILKTIENLEASGQGYQAMGFTNKVIANINKINDEFETFELKDLISAVEKGKGADPKMQIAVLMNYLEYEAQGRLLSNYMQAISYDNKKTKSMQENTYQVSKWQRSETEDFIYNPNAILENTFLGEMKIQKEDVFNMFRQFFVSLDPEIQKVFVPLYDKLDNPDFFATKDDAIELLNKYQNFVIGYILHTTSYINNEEKQEKLSDLYKDMFMGDETMASLLDKYKKSVDPLISDNLIIKELLPVMTDNVNKTDNISLFRNKIDTIQTNNIIEALNNLKSYSVQIADKNLENFVDNLAKFSILQSGLSSSKVDYKRVLSTELYSDFVKLVVDRFLASKESGNTLDVKDVWRNFHQNNHMNRSIVPKVPSYLKVSNGVLLIKPTSGYATNDYVIKTVKKKTVTAKEMKKLRKEGRMYEAFENILFENTGLLNKKGMMIFEPIGKRGNGTKLLEIYSDPNQESIILDNNFSSKTATSKMDSEGYVKATDLFPHLKPASQEATEEPLKDQIAPEGLPPIDDESEDSCISPL